MRGPHKMITGPVNRQTHITIASGSSYKSYIFFLFLMKHHLTEISKL